MSKEDLCGRLCVVGLSRAQRQESRLKNDLACLFLQPVYRCVLASSVRDISESSIRYERRLRLQKLTMGMYGKYRPAFVSIISHRTGLDDMQIRKSRVGTRHKAAISRYSQETGKFQGGISLYSAFHDRSTVTTSAHHHYHRLSGAHFQDICS